MKRDGPTSDISAPSASGPGGPLPGSPDIGENTDFQRGFWRVQRVGWVLLTLLLVLALLGLTGGRGWLSEARVEDGVMSVDYPVLTRQQTESIFTVTLRDVDETVMLHFDKAFQDVFSIVSVTPTPEGAFATSWGVGYRVEAGGAEGATVQIRVEPIRPTVAHYSIVADGRMAMLTTTVLP